MSTRCTHLDQVRRVGPRTTARGLPTGPLPNGERTFETELDERELHVDFWRQPVEVLEPIAFDRDHVLRSYVGANWSCGDG